MKITLAPKFGGPVQKWDRACLGGRGGLATKLQAPAPPTPSPPVMGAAHRAMILGCLTRGATTRWPVACGRKWGPGLAKLGPLGIGRGWPPPTSVGSGHRPPRPCGGAPPPTAMGLRQRSFVNVMDVHNLEIMAPIFGS
jgi:hypothetical protein